MRKNQLWRALASIGVMTLSCATGAAFAADGDVEVVSAAILFSLFMAPAALLFAIAASLMPSKPWIRNIAYFSYPATWMTYFAYLCFNGADYMPYFGRLYLVFTVVAVVPGYAPLLSSWRFSVRTLLIVSTIVAAMMGLLWSIRDMI